jgi:hypothetical protein
MDVVSTKRQRASRMGGSLSFGGGVKGENLVRQFGRTAELDGQRPPAGQGQDARSQPRLGAHRN